MAGENTVVVTALTAQDGPAGGLPTLAVGEPVSGDAVTVVPEDGLTVPPIGALNFDAGQEPLEDGVVYTAQNGMQVYRPQLRVAARPVGQLAGPDVWFRKDDQGALRLDWTLADVPPPDAPAGAVPLMINVDSARLVWSGNSWGLGPVEREDRAEPPRFLLRGRDPLTADQAQAFEAAMSDPGAQCQLEIQYSYDYTQGVAGDESVLPYWEALGLIQRQGADVIGYPPDEQLAANGITREQFDAAVPHVESRQQTVVRLVPFTFVPDDVPNLPIYRALHGLANLTDEWRKSPAGWVRGSDFPNTVYRIPDELRLAFNPALGTPHVIPTLHTDESGASAVRVLLRVAPWQDPRQVLQTRALVAAPGAHVVVGPVSGATLRLGGSFPEAITVLGGAQGVAVPLAEGADLLMDLSLEYFQLLCGMLGGAVGLPGQVEVTLAAGSTTPVPVNLRMDLVNDLPVAVDLVAPAGGGPPAVVRLTNRAGTAVRIGGCEAVFLLVAPDSLAPGAAYRARCTSAFPIELAAEGAGATAELSFERTEAPAAQERWNAIQVELLDKAMVADARGALLRATELGGSGELTWELKVSSPVFAATPPPRWANLAGIEVEINAEGFDPATVVLRPDTPARTVTMRKPLTELVAGGASGIRTASYRVRNNYTDHQGQWTEPQRQSGDDLVVYPNPAPGD